MDTALNILGAVILIAFIVWAFTYQLIKKSMQTKPAKKCLWRKIPLSAGFINMLKQLNP